MSVRLLLMSLLSTSGVAQAAAISWNTPFDVVTPAAILNAGVTVDAYNATPHTTANVVVHQVDFLSGTSIFGQTYPNTPLDIYSTGYRSLNTLLSGFDHSVNTVEVIQVGSSWLNPRELYAVQLFYTDVRSCCLGRRMTFDDRQGNAVTLRGDGSAPGTGSFGESVVGYFIADGVSQDLRVDGNGIEVHITGYQVRHIPRGTIVPPAPATGGGAPVEFDVLGLQPGDEVVIISGHGVGASAVSGCPGVSTGLRRPLVVGQATADGAGVATVTRSMPGWMSGQRVFMQAVRPATCEVFDVLALDIQ